MKLFLSCKRMTNLLIPEYWNEKMANRFYQTIRSDKAGYGITKFMRLTFAYQKEKVSEKVAWTTKFGVHD